MTTTTLPDLLPALSAVLPPGGVSADDGDGVVYESDGFTLTRARPEAVVFPATTDEAAAAVRAVVAAGGYVVPRGAGTGLTGGCVAGTGGVIVCTSRMNHIVEIDLPNRVAHVQAGVRNLQLSDAVARLPGGQRWHFAPDPSSQRASTIGGNAATNAGGVHTLKDFVTSNHVLGMEFVTSAGDVLTLGGRGGASGGLFDLPALVCGSEGTLGLVTSLWVRLSPRPIDFRTAVATFASRRAACEAIGDVIAAGLLPAAMEMLDGRMIRLVNDTFRLGIDPAAEALLLCEFDGSGAALQADMADTLACFQRHGAAGVRVSGDPAERATLWKARKAAFGALGKISPSYCTQDACVPRSLLADVLEGITRIGLEHGLVINNIFHAGDGNIHPVFLYDDRDPEQVRRVLEAAEATLRMCVDLGGTVTGEHGVGVEKLAMMPYQFDQPTLEAFGGVKAAFDPTCSANPGKRLPDGRVRIEVYTAPQSLRASAGRRVPQ